MKHQPRGIKEDPVYQIPERHAPNSIGGTTHWGNEINGSYKQPWVQHDPVAEENPKVG